VKYQTQIAALMATKGIKAARMAEIMETAEKEGRSTNSAESKEFDDLDAEIKAVESDLARFQRLEGVTVAQARSVDTSTTQRQVTDHDEGNGRGPTVIIRNKKNREEKFRGQNFTRMVIARTAAMLGNFEVPAYVIAQKRWGDDAGYVPELLRTAVAGGGTGSGEWGAELVQADGQYRGDFIEYLYSKTVYDQLPLRVVPANVTIKGQDGQGTGYWVGESKAIPATALDFSAVTLTPLKVAALAVMSNDLIRYADPSSELLVRDGLVNASAQRIDTTFLSATAASAGVSPAGMLNGVSALSADGEDAESLNRDVGRLYAPFITAKNAGGLYWVMSTGLAKALSLMKNPFNQTLFPNLTAQGGTFEGDPVVTGDNVAADDLILLKPSDIFRIGDTGFEVAISKEATIEQDTAPTGATDTPTAASATLTNMFQEDSSAIRVIRHINFAKRRSGVVQYVGDASYHGSST